MDLTFEDLCREIEGRTMLEPDRLGAFWRMQSLLPPGQIAEVGVRDGGVSHFLARMCPDRIVFAFDTFEGFPPSAEDEHFEWGEMRSQPGTLGWLERTPNVWPVVGEFPHTLATHHQCQRFALVHFDADTFAAAEAALRFFWPRLYGHGFLVIDDFGRPNCPGVLRAVEQFLPDWERHQHEHHPQWNQLVLRMNANA